MVEEGFTPLFLPLGALITAAFKITVQGRASNNSTQDPCLFAIILCAELYNESNEK